MFKRTEELTVGFRRSQLSRIKGPRTRDVVKFNPNKAGPGETIGVNVSSLFSTGQLRYDFKNKNTKSWFRNNLSKILQERTKIVLSGEFVYDNIGESLLSTYEDLWINDSVRDNMVEDGIAALVVRKKISRDDATNDDQDAAAFFQVYGMKQRMQLSHIVKDHGLHAGYDLTQDFSNKITLPQADKIMDAQTSQNVKGYEVQSLELEYETIKNAELAREIQAGYGQGRYLSYVHKTLMKTVVWDKDSTLTNEIINPPTKLMRAIIML